jgi:hypothetical protein
VTVMVMGGWVDVVVVTAGTVGKWAGGRVCGWWFLVSGEWC